MFALLTGTANAQSIINQNISGFNLPGVQLPTGHDEVRAADGTTCRSAVSGSGAYLDVGIIGNPNQEDSTDISHYGRIVIPLGKQTKRLDCSRLYDLEVQRLQMELRLMQMGLGRGVTPPSGTAVAGEVEADIEAVSENETGNSTQKAIETASVGTGNWDDEGWTTDGKEQ
jgi:hypothetical protein